MKFNNNIYRLLNWKQWILSTTNKLLFVVVLLISIAPFLIDQMGKLFFRILIMLIFLGFCPPWGGILEKNNELWVNCKLKLNIKKIYLKKKWKIFSALGSFRMGYFGTITLIPFFARTQTNRIHSMMMFWESDYPINANTWICNRTNFGKMISKYGKKKRLMKISRTINTRKIAIWKINSQIE